MKRLKRLCPHVWRRRQRVWSWTVYGDVSGCRSCRRKWNKEHA